MRERHSSPDGSLVLVVDGTDGDLAVRFEGYEWHTHGDLFVGSYGPTEAQAVATFVDQILSDRLAIAVCSRNGAVRDVRVTDDPATDGDAAAGEYILFAILERSRVAC